MKKIYLTLFSITFLFSGLACAIDKEVLTAFKELQQKKTALQIDPAVQVQTANEKTADVTVHFIWASWCEVCERAYANLIELKKDDQLKDKVHWIGYSVEDQMSTAVSKKAKLMTAMPQYFASKKDLSWPASLDRFPIVIVESQNAEKDLEVFTGFTNERFYYLKKSILRGLSATESMDENVE